MDKFEYKKRWENDSLININKFSESSKSIKTKKVDWNLLVWSFYKIIGIRGFLEIFCN